jgi:hypothetical protein
MWDFMWPEVVFNYRAGMAVTFLLHERLWRGNKVLQLVGFVNVLRGWRRERARRYQRRDLAPMWCEMMSFRQGQRYAGEVEGREVSLSSV